MRRILSSALVLLLLLGAVSCSGGGKTGWQDQYDEAVEYLKNDQFEDAIKAFEAAIQADPQKPDAYLGLADVYLEMGEPDKAAEILERALETIENEDDLSRIREKQEEINEADSGGDGPEPDVRLFLGNTVKLQAEGAPDGTEVTWSISGWWDEWSEQTSDLSACPVTVDADGLVSPADSVLSGLAYIEYSCYVTVTAEYTADGKPASEDFILEVEYPCITFEDLTTTILPIGEQMTLRPVTNIPDADFHFRTAGDFYGNEPVTVSDDGVITAERPGYVYVLCGTDYVTDIPLNPGTTVTGKDGVPIDWNEDEYINYVGILVWDPTTFFKNADSVILTAGGSTYLYNPDLNLDYNNDISIYAESFSLVSSDPNVVSVEGDNYLTSTQLHAIGAGTATVTATWSCSGTEYSDVLTVQVNPAGQDA